MATLYITEYSRLMIDDRGATVVVGQEPSLTQTAAIGGGSTQSAAFRPNTKFVRLHTDAICNVAFSADTSAVAIANASLRLAANQTEFFGISGGGLLAVIAGT